MPARPPYWALGSIIALGAVLRFSTLSEQSYWFDETFTVALVKRDFGGMLDGVALTESTPPLYYVLAWLWAKVFGTGEAGLRSLSALVGTAAIPVAYAAGAELRSQSTGLALAALAATGPFLVWYSQEARAYSLLFFFSAVSVWLVARALRHPSRTTLVAWGFVAALALATHYFAGFLVVAEAACLFRERETRRRMLVPTLGLAAAGVALLPLALHQQSNKPSFFISDLSLTRRLLEAPKQLVLGFDSPFEHASILLVAAVVVAGCVLALRQLRRADGGLAVAFALTVGALGLPALLSFAGVDYFYGRNVITAWLPLAAVAAAGLLSLRGGVTAVVLLCILGLSSVVGTALDPRWQRQDWRGIAQAIGPPSVERAILVPGGGRKALELYRHATRTGAPHPVSELVVVAPISPLGTGGHSGPPPRPTPPLPVPPPGFRAVERRYEDSFSLVRFRSGRPTRLSADDVKRVALDSRSLAVFYES